MKIILDKRDVYFMFRSATREHMTVLFQKDGRHRIWMKKAPMIKDTPPGMYTLNSYYFMVNKSRNRAGV